eukprot:GDKK01007379.1.p1 GENE.GDKK01007379.1~~GDKK01007379.1.p1  ORF type:complete len:369 (+),score=40.23 GDKK01007379.1:27-1133(+)
MSRRIAEYLPRDSLYPLCLASGGFNFTHWQKKKSSGDQSIPSGAYNDDAWCASPFYTIVCDGVSSIRSLGQDGFKLPRELTLLLTHHISQRTFLPHQIRELIWTCAKDCREIGSTTCTVAVLDDKTNILYGLAFGDSSLIVLRQTITHRYKVVFESSSMSLSFNKPFQINTYDRPDNENHPASHQNSTQNPSAGRTQNSNSTNHPLGMLQWLLNLRNLLDACPLIQFQLEAGDLVMVCSDGLTDNLDMRTIERVVNASCFPLNDFTANVNLNSTSSGVNRRDRTPPHFNNNNNNSLTMGGNELSNSNLFALPAISMDILSKNLTREALKRGCSRVFDSKLDARWVDDDLIPDKWPQSLDWATSFVKKT